MVVMITGVAWIRRGVAAAEPDVVRADTAAIQQLVEVAPSSNEQTDKVDQAQDDSEFLDEYHDNSDDEVRRPTLSGVAVFADNKDDPYLMSDVEDSDEDDEIKPNDNLVAVTKIDSDAYNLDVYVYNDDEKDWYVHHDYPLSAPPLCVAPIAFDPEDPNDKGNMVAIGTMKKTIQLWDLDVVNACTPVTTLGKKKRGVIPTRHKSSILSISWNSRMKHVLASGGADESVILWNLAEATAAQVIPGFGSGVQSLQWHLDEMTIFAAGTLGGLVSLTDCRNADPITPATWEFDSEIEKVIWDHFNPYCLFVAAENGCIYYADSRKPQTAVWTHNAHERSCEDIALSPGTSGLLVSVSVDEYLRVWRTSAEGLKLVESTKCSLGRLHSAAFCPDAPSVVLIGGEAEELVRIVDLRDSEAVVSEFSS